MPEMKAQSLRFSLCVARRPTCHFFWWSGVNNALLLAEKAVAAYHFKKGAE